MKAKKIILDKEEKDLLESFEKGEWKTVNGVKRKLTNTLPMQN